MLMVGKECGWVSVCLMNLGASSGQIIIVPGNTAVGADVSIHTLGAIGVGMVALCCTVDILSCCCSCEPA